MERELTAAGRRFPRFNQAILISGSFSSSFSVEAVIENAQESEAGDDRDDAATRFLL